MTLRTAKIYYDLLHTQEGDTQLLSLEGRQVYERGDEMKALEAQYLIPATKFVFVMPEYNASFPGVLKLMIDNSDIKKCWNFKKAMLIGLSDGRAGNLRGIEHMTAILNYLKVTVFYDKLPLSKIKEEVDPEGHLKKSSTEEVIKRMVNEFILF